jgi:hypothetical protein
MKVKLYELGDAMKKKSPACAVCGYDAEWLLGFAELERLICDSCLEKALVDVLLDCGCSTSGSNILLG